MLCRTLVNQFPLSCRNTFLCTILFLTSDFKMASGAADTPFENSAEGAKLVTANGKFAWSLYQQEAAANGAKNVFMSPLSISVALAMTYLGAEGNTRTQMKDTMFFGDVNPVDLNQAFSDIRSALKSKDDAFKLFLANRLFGEKSYTFLKTFLEESQKYFGADLQPVDFSKSAEAVRIVNDWVAENTNQKIQNILPESAVNELTRLILVNAIYFKGDWNKKFDAAATVDSDFHVSSSEKVQVPLMHLRKTKVSYGSNTDLDCQAIALDYINKSLSMYILLPDGKDGSLATLESKLTVEHLTNVHELFRMRQVDVNIWVPRFKLTEELDLGETLARMGMSDLFSEGKADLSGIDGTKQLFISKVLHKAFIEVNEEGSEAAAATAVVANLRSAAIFKEFDFRADHPFLFFIQENSTKSILFLGRLVKP